MKVGDLKIGGGKFQAWNVGLLGGRIVTTFVDEKGRKVGGVGGEGGMER